MSGINTEHTYQYGSDPKHTIKLTEAEAHAANNIVVLKFDPETGHALINSYEIDINAYNRAAKKLNDYIDSNGGSIPCTDEWLEDHDILTLVD